MSNGIYDGLTYNEACDFRALDRWWKGRALALQADLERARGLLEQALSEYRESSDAATRLKWFEQTRAFLEGST